MSEYPVFIIIAALILGYGLFSKLAENQSSLHPWYLFWLDF
jgi:hypothetical protein